MPVFSRDVPRSGGAGLVPTSVLLLSLIAPASLSGSVIGFQCAMFNTVLIVALSNAVELTVM